MSQKVFFRYNKATEQYERVFPDRKQRFIASVRVYVWATLIVAGLALALYYLVDSPRERILRQKNEALQQRFELLNRRADKALAVLEDIAERDNNFYRVMMQAEPMTSHSDMQALKGNETTTDLTPWPTRRCSTTSTENSTVSTACSCRK